MIAHWDIVQGTEDWHRLRYGKIGGSTSAGLRVKSKTLLWQILAQRMEDFKISDEDGFESPAMKRGNELEPLARRELSSYTGISFKEVGWLQCEEIPLFGISPDGISEDLRFECEIKCPSDKKHSQTLEEGMIPPEHNEQLLHSFTVNPFLEAKYFASFRPECEIPLFVPEPMTRESFVDLGTKAKPDIRQVSEWVKVFKGLGMGLESDLQSTLKRLRSI